jgi:hypothetical protein
MTGIAPPENAICAGAETFIVLARVPRFRPANRG